jgi:predicted PurR-regulated permease PerM
MDTDNNTTTINTSPKKISLGLVLGWVFGFIFGLAGFVSVFSEPVTGILMLILGAILLPPTYKIILEKLNISISKGLKIVLVILLLVEIGASTPSDVPQSKELTNQDPNSVPTSDNQNNSVENTEVSQVQSTQPEPQSENTPVLSENTPGPAISS